MSTEIKYNGSVIASLKGGETATLACAGKLMESNVVVTADSGGGSASVETCSVSFDLSCETYPIRIHYTNGDMENVVHAVSSFGYVGTLTCAKGTSVFIGNGIRTTVDSQYINTKGGVLRPYSNWPLLLVNGDGSVEYEF